MAKTKRQPKYRMAVRPWDRIFPGNLVSAPGFLGTVAKAPYPVDGGRMAIECEGQGTFTRHASNWLEVALPYAPVTVADAKPGDVIQTGEVEVIDDFEGWRITGPAHAVSGRVAARKVFWRDGRWHDQSAITYLHPTRRCVVVG